MELEITALTHTGEFDGHHGLMQTFSIAFSNGWSGQCNAKSNPPPYKIGDTKLIEKTGEFKGVAKYSVKKIDGQASSGGYSGQSSPSSSGKSAYNPSGARIGMVMNNVVKVINAYKEPFESQRVIGLSTEINGAALELESKGIEGMTVGNIINNSVDLLIAQNKEITTAYIIEIARMLYSAMLKLEKKAETPPPAAAEPVVETPPPAERQTGGHGESGKEAYDSTKGIDDGEDVPF